MAALRSAVAISPAGLQRSLAPQADLLSKRQQLRVASVTPKSRPTSERKSLVVRASDERFDIGDYGARDPRPSELESQFGDKVLGNADTEHRILLPSGITYVLQIRPGGVDCHGFCAPPLRAEVAGLAARNCAPLPAGTQPLAEPGARELLKRVVGWKLVSEPSGLRLRGEWRVRDEESGGELMRRMGAVVEGQQEQCGGGQQADMSMQQGYVVRVDLHTPAIGGLSENDFIIAAKMDLVKVSDLIKKARFWA
ncbi:unnamed protein product [Closterium sp. Naga37s-1]|nr:unnamed protein product [Closterium sp. Naga37s-1]